MKLGPIDQRQSVSGVAFPANTPQSADLRSTRDELEPARRRWAKTYSPQLLELIDWCMQLPIPARPQSVHKLQKVLAGELLDLIDPVWFKG